MYIIDATCQALRLKRVNDRLLSCLGFCFSGSRVYVRPDGGVNVMMRRWLKNNVV